MDSQMVVPGLSTYGGPELVAEVFADGGYEGGRGYGSLRVTETEGGRMDLLGQSIRFPLPLACTSNEAEYLALLKAMEILWLHLRDRKAHRCGVKLYSDSQLVVNQVNGSWKVSAPNLLPLRKRLLAVLNPLRSWGIEWVPRQTMVDLFGH